MKKAIASAGLLALGAVGAQTAAAQVTAGNDKIWSVSASLRGFYDDNIYTAPSDPQSSTGFDIKPSVALNYSEGPNMVAMSFVYDYRYYGERADNKADQGLDFELALSHNFNERYSIGFSDSFVISQEPEVLAGTGALAFPLRSNGDNKRNTANLNFHAQLTRLFGIVLSYNNTYYDYDENNSNNPTPTQPSRSALLDRFEQLLTFDTTWLLGPQTTGVVGYKFGMVNYTSGENILSPLPPGNVPFVASSTRDNYSHYVYVGADHNFRRDLTGSLRLGLQYLDYYKYNDSIPFPGQATSALSPYADISLNYLYADGGHLIFGFQQVHNQTDVGINAATIASGPTQDQESSVVYLNVNQRLTPLSPKLIGSIIGNYQHSIFNGGAVDGLVDNFYLLGLNLTYEFTHYISAEAGYNYDLLVSQLPSRGYDRNRVYVGVIATY